MEFKTLYKKNTNGSIQEWTVFVNKNNIHTRYGKQGGKLQTNVETISSGLNLGKSNATTPETQALAEALASYTVKLKRGYVEVLEDAEAGIVDTTVITGGMFPMLAQSYSKHGDKIIFPALLQPKLDGTRMIAIRDNGIWGLWSRTRKPITGLPHIIAALDQYSTLGGEDYIFDGEAYNHDYKNKFEELIHFIKQEKVIPGSEVVQFHIYDIGHPGFNSSQRQEILNNITFVNADPLKIVPSISIGNEEDMMVSFELFLEKGYEGAMVRNRLGMYVNKRSFDLQKVKTFEDSEFLVVDIEEGKGSMAGKAIFVCETKEGVRFGAKMIGSMSDLEKYVQNPELVVGKMVTIKYQGFTTKNKCPRFPVAIRIHNEL